MTDMQYSKMKLRVHCIIYQKQSVVSYYTSTSCLPNAGYIIKLILKNEVTCTLYYISETISSFLLHIY